MKQKKGFIFSVIFSILMLLIVIGLSVALGITKSNLKGHTINIYGVNDYHGQIDEQIKSTELPDGTHPTNPGISKFSTYINNQKAKDRREGNESLVLSAGDNFQGSLVSNVNNGMPIIEMFDEIGIKYSALGNHEFDWDGQPWSNSDPETRHFVSWEKYTDLEFLAANFVMKGTDQQPEGVDPYAIESFNLDGIGKVDVGILGLSTVETSGATNPINVADYEFLDAATTAQKYVPQMKQDGADVIVVLGHLGSNQNYDGSISGEAVEVAKVEGVDAVLSGHSHSFVDGNVYNEADQKYVPVLQAGSFGSGVSKLSVTFDKDSNNDPYVTNIDGDVHHFYDREVEKIKPNKNLDKKIKRYIDEADAIANENVGEIPFDLRKSYSQSNDVEIGNSQLGSWIADAMLYETKTQYEGTLGGIDLNNLVSLQNYGGIRKDLEQGPVTYGELYEIMPFDNQVTLIKMKGSDLENVLRQGLNDYPDKTFSGKGFIQYSGIRISGDGSNYNTASGASTDSNIQKIELLDLNKSKSTKKLVWNELNPDEDYYVVAPDFIIDEGDGYIFEYDEAFGINILDTIRNMMKQYLEESFTGNSSWQVFYEPDGLSENRYVTI